MQQGKAHNKKEARERFKKEEKTEERDNEVNYRILIPDER